MLVLLTVLQVASTPVSGPPPPPPLTTGTSAISGRVIDAATGAPIAGARVRLGAMTRRSDDEITASNDPNRLVLRPRAPEGEARSDAAGRYEFAGIAAGDYLLSAQSRGYVTRLYGAPPWPNERAFMPIALDEGQQLTRINLTLRPGATVRGRVVDEAGRPLRNARVVAITGEDAGLRPNPVVATAAPTDDDGRYTLEGVPEGRFLMQAMPLVDPANPGAGSRDYVPTYHPSATDPSEAAGVVIKGVSMITGIDITVRRKALYSIAGHALTLGGEILDATEVVLESVPPGFRYHTGGVALSEGAFSFDRLKPGRYILWARSPVGDGFEAAALPLTLDDSLADVQLLLVRTGAIAGRVQSERGEPIPIGLTVVATLTDAADEAASVDSGTVEADGTFTLDRVFGQRNLSVSGLPDDWMIKKIVVGRFEVTAPHVTMASGVTVDNVQLVIGRR